jgi:serine/threonine-protein kinase
MATVYLAHDERHDRMVALKILRPELAAVIGADRFLIEIKTTANLQHPHILPLHDSGELGGTVWYVMPLVEGESLRDRLTRETQLPIDDALQIAREVASALDYAHRHGVVHRDIKPENILLHDGRAVVADFGIALAVSRTDGGTRLTETGMSLGTPHYMSPEQALGERTVDARTDVYALGAVSYEMLTGEPPFTGPTAQAIIAKVMNAPPPSIAASRPTVPSAVEAAILRALSKLPADRFRSAADFAAALQTGMTASHTATGAPVTALNVAPTARDTRARWLPWGIAAVALIAAGIFGMRRVAPSAERVTAAVIPLEIRIPKNMPQNEVGVPISISPDGSFIVFVGLDPETTGSTALWVRQLDRLTATVIPGTHGVQAPVVAGDGKTVQFMMRVSSQSGNTRWEVGFDGGLPQLVGAFIGLRRLGNGASVVAHDSVVHLVRAGEAMPPTAGRVMQGRALFSVSPDVRWIARTKRVALRDSIVLVGVDNRRRFVVAEGSTPTFLDNDLLAFRAADSTLRVGRLAADRSRFVAPPTSIVSSVSLAGDQSAIYAVSDDGTLIYVQGGSAAQSRPVWVDGTRELPLPNAKSRVYGGVALSPDGHRAALTVGALTAAGDIWVSDVANGTLSPLTSDGISTRATWTRDNKAVTYLHSTVGLSIGFDTAAPARLYTRTPDRGAPADSMSAPFAGHGIDEIDWSPDMRYLAIRTRSGPRLANRDIAVWRIGSDSVIRIATEAAQERGPRFSPDGKLVLYVSDRAGRAEVFVEAFPEGGNRVPISAEGGTEAIWSRDGSQVFYRAADGWMMSAHIARGAKAEVTRRDRLFDANSYLANEFLQMYDVAPDGRFLMLKLDAQPERTDVIIIRNWVQQVKARLSERKQ